MAESTVRRRYFVRGRVQGVGYRAYVLRQAAVVSVRGWVRNRLDGRVELMAEGEPEAQLLLLEALEKGPMWARVDAVESVDVAERDEPLPGFKVRSTV